MAIMMTREAIATVPITGSKKRFMKLLVTTGFSGTGLSESNLKNRSLFVEFTLKIVQNFEDAISQRDWTDSEHGFSFALAWSNQLLD